MNGIVQCKFRKRKKFAPTRKRVRITVQNIFQNTVDAFSLTVGFWMCCSRHRQLCSNKLENSTPESGSKSWITIRDNFLRHSMVPEDSIYKDTCSLFCSDRIANSRDVNHLAESINKHNNPVVFVAVGWIPEDEIHTYGLPIIPCHGKRL